MQPHSPMVPRRSSQSFPAVASLLTGSREKDSSLPTRDSAMQAAARYRRVCRPRANPDAPSLVPGE